MAQQLNLELTKVQGAFLYPFDVNGKQVEYICMPVGQNNVKVIEKTETAQDGSQKATRRCFWGLSIIKSQQPKASKLKDFFFTHFVKPYVSKSDYSAMSEEQRKAIPIIGDIQTHKDELYGGGQPMMPQQGYYPPQQQGYYPPQQPMYGQPQQPVYMPPQPQTYNPPRQ